jgi:hypothetical protein
MNHVDFAFLTDHPNRMAETDFTTLLLVQSGDQQTLGGTGQPIANQITCGDGHQITLTVGFEDQLMTFAMTQHADPTDLDARSALYGTATTAAITQLKADTNALVFIPHTESRSDELLATLATGGSGIDDQINGVEIYNLHANINPTMRETYLGWDRFHHLLDVTVYFFDPFANQQPDLAFLFFLRVSDVYAQKWNKLIALGRHITGISGNDSHQNFFPGLANDGDRVDSHRRLTRWITNYFLTQHSTLNEIKAALVAGRGMVVFEGLGTPVGMDFYAQNSTTIAEMGDTLTFESQSTHVHAALPTLHSASPQSGKPIVLMRLRRASTVGTGDLIATTVNAPLDVTVSQTGAYRLEVSLIPMHLYSFIGFKKQLAVSEIPWVITNHIYIQ